MTMLTCPGCHRSLRVAQEVPAGTEVQCPACREVFAPTGDEEPMATELAAPERDEPRLSRRDERPFALGAPRVRRQRAPSQGIIITVIVASVAFVTMVAIILVLVFRSPGPSGLVGRWRLIEENGQRRDFRQVVQF